MPNNSIRKKILYQIPVLLIILSISVPMVTAPGLSNTFFPSPSISVNRLVYAEDEVSSGGDHLTSSTTTDPILGYSLIGLTVTKENANPSLVEETEEQDLDCSYISEKNFKVSEE
jgi:hypothetical protein